MKAKLLGICSMKNEELFVFSHKNEIVLVERNVINEEDEDDDNLLIIGKTYDIEEDFLLCFSKKDFYMFEKGIHEAVSNLIAK